MPDGFWDPKWKDPHVATLLARNAYRSLRFKEEDFPNDPLAHYENLDLSEYDERSVESQTFALTEIVEVEDFGTTFKGGSYGEVFKRYSFGISTIFFHAQGLCFGIDNEGRFFLQGQVGRINGTWGKKAAIGIYFKTKDGLLGCFGWEAQLDPPQDIQMYIVGKDDKVRDNFHKIIEVEVAFYTFCIEP